MAHRLQLLTEKAANRCPIIIKYIAELNTFVKALKYSPKLCHILESSKELYREDAIKVKQVCAHSNYIYIYNSIEYVTITILLFSCRWCRVCRHYNDCLVGTRLSAEYVLNW